MRRPSLVLIGIAALAALAASSATRRAAPPQAAPPTPVAIEAAPADVATPATLAAPAVAATPAEPVSRPARRAAVSAVAPAEAPAAGFVIRRDDLSDTAPADDGFAATRALDIESLQDLARAEAAGLVTVRNADGSETLNHEGRFADFSVVRVGPNGRPLFSCVHGHAGCRMALRPDLPARAASEEE